METKEIELICTRMCVVLLTNRRDVSTADHVTRCFQVVHIDQRRCEAKAGVGGERFAEVADDKPQSNRETHGDAGVRRIGRGLAV